MEEEYKNIYSETEKHLLRLLNWVNKEIELFVKSATPEHKISGDNLKHWESYRQQLLDSLDKLYSLDAYIFQTKEVQKDEIDQI